MNILLKNIKINSIATTVPKNKISYEQLCEQFGEREVSRIVASTGINSLGVANPGMNTSDLCVNAAEQLLNTNELRGEIDAVVFVSQTPDFVMPATACVIQHRLRLSQDIVAFDINSGCTGYLYGLYQAALLISSGSCQKVLLCAGDTISRYINPDDHKVRMVLGDAGSASIIEAGNDDWAFDIHTDGAGYDKLIIPKNKEGHNGHLHMDGAAIMEFALKSVPRVVDNVLSSKKWQKEDVQHYFLHQANKFMLDYLRKTMRISCEQVPIAVAEYGNTGPASIPLAICHHFPGQGHLLGKSILSGFGVGLTWGAVALNLGDARIAEPVIL